jgi:CheY-like chemotaxis protein
MANAPTTQTPHSLDGARILVVEDNPVIAYDIADSLEEAKAVVLVRGRVMDALAALENEEPIDGAVLDVNLPDGVVTPVADRLFARRVPVIFCTGVGLPFALKQRFPDAVVFMKPVMMSQLIGRLAQLIGR